MPNYPPMITLFTDAGFCQTIMRGTWASWAKYEGVAHLNSGFIRADCRNSNDAEMYAICNGFCSTLAHFKPPSNTLVLIQSDCTGAIAIYERFRFMHRNVVNTDESVPPSVMSFMERANHYNVRFEFRHVKGHRGHATRRNSVNSTCDQRCTELLQILRKQEGYS